MDRLDQGCFGNWQIDPSPLDGWLVFGAGHVSDVRIDMARDDGSGEVSMVLRVVIGKAVKLNAHIYLRGLSN